MHKPSILSITLAIVFAIGGKLPSEELEDQRQDLGNMDLITFNNEEFYQDGLFDAEKGKDAIVNLMRYHGYPIFSGIRERIWVSDYGAGDFTKLGLALIILVDNKDYRYMLMDMFLLPGQMLPEHLHRPMTAHDGGPLLRNTGEFGDAPAKSEAWLVRHGLSYIVGMGDDNLQDFPITVPQSHRGGTTDATYVTEAGEGVVVELRDPQASPAHWQFAGPEGAVITEVASFHSLSDVIYIDKELNDYITGQSD